jgi:hypothetical protein
MPHTFDNSSSIQSIDHVDGCLHVTFRSGKTYRYKDCPNDHFEAMKACPSPGKYFQTMIRGQYEHDSD